MLALGRKEGESTYFTVPPSGDPTVIRVIVAKVQRGKARLVCEAPAPVVIEREEIRRRRLEPVD